MEDIKVMTTPTSEEDCSEVLPKRVKLRTANDIFEVMAKFTRLCAMGRCSESRYRSIIYGLNNMLNALKAKALEGEENDGKRVPNPLAYIIEFPDAVIEKLYEFYELYWWVPHIKAHPPEKHEARNFYYKRLKDELGFSNNPGSILDLQFDPVLDPKEIDRIHDRWEAERNAAESLGTEDNGSEKSTNEEE